MTLNDILQQYEQKRDMSDEVLAKCYCGGEVNLFPSTPWQQDPVIFCRRCGGKWSYGTYSDSLTIKEWNKGHK